MGFGGGSSSGGGSSGKVEYPAYMQAWHGKILDTTATTSPSSDITTVMNTALSANPFTAAAAYNPTTTLDAAAISVLGLTGLNFNTLVSTAISDIPTIAAAVDAILTGANSLIAADVAAYSDMVDNEINVKILPKYHRGMQDINAVQSSSYVIGEALLWAEKARDVAKFAADLELRAYSERNQLIAHMSDYELRAVLARVEYAKIAAQYAIEFARIIIVAYKEQLDKNLDIEEKEATWDFRVFQAGGNILASITGAASTVNSNPTMGSMLGGTLAGVAGGAMMGAGGGPPGIAIGAVLGGLAGLFSSR